VTSGRDWQAALDVAFRNETTEQTTCGSCEQCKDVYTDPVPPRRTYQSGRDPRIF
jgi:hypothetical protein